MQDTVIALKEQNEKYEEFNKELKMLVDTICVTDALPEMQRESLTDMVSDFESNCLETTATLKDLETEAEEQAAYIQTLEDKVKSGDTEETDA